MTQPKKDMSFGLAWAIEYAPVILFLALLVVASGMIYMSYYFDRRLDDIQGQMDGSLRYQPPAVAELDDAAPILADGAPRNTTYVPAHSHVYHGDGAATPLTITLSVRNPDMHEPLTLYSAAYYDTTGKKIREFVSAAARVRPMETIEYLVGESDLTGGSGASFRVEWASVPGAAEPLIEAVMIGTRGALGISFVQRGSKLKSPAVP